MEAATIADDVELQSNNPALDFLRNACALFYRANRPGDELVKCPFCNENTPELWQQFLAITDWKGQALGQPLHYVEMRPADDRIINVLVAVKWMICPNSNCKEIIVQIQKHSVKRSAVLIPNFKEEEFWLAVPRKPFPRPIDPLVGDPYRRDYMEASLILDDSPRMSSVLSRRILQDLLEQFAGRTEYKLEDRIDNFIADTKYPSNIKENLHHLRDIANFAAHKKTDKATGEIIEVDRDEADWTLEVVDGLFDYFIVGPERDKQRRANWDAKRGQTGAPRPVKKQKP
jgi:Domain of unknown function (DUF4145)